MTGSVGKTGAKEAIFTVLSSKFNVRQSLKNYNNEIGLPLTIIGAQSPGKFILGWCAVIVKAILMILIKEKEYPRILVAELAVDKPGDMGYLINIVKCKVGVVTAIGHSHLEFFGSIEKIKKEKELLIKRGLTENGWAVLNYDDEKTRAMREETGARVLTFGFSEQAEVSARELKSISNIKNKDFGVNFKLIFKGSAVPVFLPKVISEITVQAALTAGAVAIIYGFNLIEIGSALKNFKSPPGRLSLIDGIKGTLIMDDTYNSSPQSSIAALKTAENIFLERGARKIAVLGDMLELGSYTEEGHREIGRQVAMSGADVLMTVGERARDIGRGAREAGMNADNIFHFSDVGEAGLFLQDKMREGDLILIKGSQGMRMEKIVKEIMADPLRAEELLVRQGKEWEK